MPYHEDLSLCDYLERGRGLGMLAVGWLSDAHPYTRGSVPPALSPRLRSLMHHVYCIDGALGSHRCEFCAPPTTSDADNGDSYGTGSLAVPGERVIYGCPSLIVHYIDVHGYRPPDEFVTAVMECPDMCSEAYFCRLLAVGGAAWRELIQHDAGRYAAWSEVVPSPPPIRRAFYEETRRQCENMQRALRKSRPPRALLPRWLLGQG